ncbi:MAG: hypothetical protein JWR26_4270 [Pedosphaera sp.]|nr:hypothetical protein [Pedosphaera sp.]
MVKKPISEISFLNFPPSNQKGCQKLAGGGERTDTPGTPQ